jgi:hypothetical protein
MVGNKQKEESGIIGYNSAIKYILYFDYEVQLKESRRKNTKSLDVGIPYEYTKIWLLFNTP